MKILRVGVVGARVRNTPKDKDLIRNAIRHLMEKDVCVHLVSGGCSKGADRFAEELAQEMALGISIHSPDISKMKDNSKYEYMLECFRRNTLIAEECDMLIATPAYDKNGPVGGTADTIKKTCNLNKPVVLL